MQIPGLTIWYGPDTYMGENLYNMLTELAGMTDEQIGEVHPDHDQASPWGWLPTSIDFFFLSRKACVWSVYSRMLFLSRGQRHGGPPFYCFEPTLWLFVLCLSVFLRLSASPFFCLPVSLCVVLLLLPPVSR